MFSYIQKSEYIAPPFWNSYWRELYKSEICADTFSWSENLKTIFCNSQLSLTLKCEVYSVTFIQQRHFDIHSSRTHCTKSHLSLKYVELYSANLMNFVNLTEH